MSGKINKGKGKEVVEEKDETINAEEEETDDDFVETAWDNQALRRSQRNKVKEQLDKGENENVDANNKGDKRKNTKKRERGKKVVDTNTRKDKKRKVEIQDSKAGPSNTSSKKTRSPSKTGAKPLVATTFQNRCSPKSLYLACENLMPHQLACLERMGFGEVVGIKMEGIPARIGLYVVDKLDVKKMEIRLASGSIKITKDLIAEMLGVKNEGRDIEAGEEIRDAEMIARWRSQYEGVTDIKPTDVKVRIRQSKEADMNFKLNFVVLFSSIMGRLKNKGLCDLKILDYISPDTDISEINWCEYIWKSIQTCKIGWIKGKKDNFFLGPLTFLTLCYVDGTKCNTFKVARKTPPTRVWTHELLSEREDAEVASGGIGKGDLEDPFVEEEQEPPPVNIEGCLWLLNKYVKDMDKLGIDFERTLDAAMKMSAGNSEMQGLVEQYGVVRNKASISTPSSISNINVTMGRTEERGKDAEKEKGDVSIEDFVEEGSKSKGKNKVDDAGAPMETMVEWGPETQKLAVESIDRATMETMGHGFDSPGAMIGQLTHDAFVKVAVEVDRTIEKAKAKDDLDYGPSFSLGLTPDFATARETLVTPNASKDSSVISSSVPISFCPPSGVAGLNQGKEKRQKSLTQAMRSPFEKRILEAEPNYTADEIKMGKYLFLMTAYDMREVLYASRCGRKLSRDQLHDLGEEYVENHMLDAWAVVMNSREAYRSHDSPLRLFLPTYVVDKKSFSVKPYDNDRLQALVQHIENAARNKHDFKTLKNIDLAFLPVDNQRHQFLLAFDLKYGCVIMFDQRKIGRKPKSKVKGKLSNLSIAELLHTDFSRYLFNLGHAKAGNVFKAELEIAEFEGQTAKVRHYAGLFVMRQMETYMGKGKSWEWGLDGNKDKLEKQMVVLRKKYATRMLLDSSNLLMAKVREDIEKTAGIVLKNPVIKLPSKEK